MQRLSPYKPPTLRSHTKRMKKTVRERNILLELEELVEANEQACLTGIEEARSEELMFQNISDCNHLTRLARSRF